MFRIENPDRSSWRPFVQIVAAIIILPLIACAKPPLPADGPGGRDAQGPRAETPYRPDALLLDAISGRERAVAEGNAARFHDLLYTGDPEFLLERTRWFEYRQSAEIRDYRLEAESVFLPPGGEGDELLVVIRQSYTIGTDSEERTVLSVDLYRKENRLWLYAGPAFAPIASDHFAVKYALPPEALGEPAAARELRLAAARRVAGQAERAWSLVLASYGEMPPGPVTLKLYPDRELLRQDSKITIPRLFNGWGEPGEPIKLWLNPDPKRDFTSILAHELVHKTTLARAANQCSWFAEGLANSLGSFPAIGGNYLDGGFHTSKDYERNLEWLENQDPETIVTDEAWWLYGGMAGAVLDFTRQTWGSDSPRRIVEELARMPQPERAYVYSLNDAGYRADLRAAIRAALGVEWKKYDELWLAWIKGRG